MDKQPSWIEIGAQLDRSLFQATKVERSKIVDDAASFHGLKVRTLLGIHKAFRYVNSHSKSVGMALGDIRAANLSIDVLIRLHKKSPQTALSIRKDVFQGRISYRRMRKIEESLDRSHKNHVLSQVDWNAFSEEFYVDYLRYENVSWAFSSNREPYSDISKLLGVDLEVTHSGGNVCVFITPQILFSEHRGKPLEEQVPKVFAATLFFDRVIYILWDEQEVAFFEKCKSASKDVKVKCIEVLERFQVDAYSCFGDDILGYRTNRDAT